jgi:hypothetical protein
MTLSQIGRLFNQSHCTVINGIKKHNDYGPKNISDAPGGPLTGLAVRLHDKVARLSNLVTNNKKPSNESLEDTFVDILNYAVIGLLVLKDKWDK